MYSGCMAMLLDAIQDAIERSGETRYQIAKGSGVSQAALSRFVHGERGLSVDAVQKLADYLELEIIVRAKRTRKTK